MLSKSPLLVIAALSALTFSACNHVVETNTDTPTQSSAQNKAKIVVTEAEPEAMEEETSSEETDAMEETSMMSDESPAPAEYLSYSSDKYNELKGSKGFALYFHAEWCPTCKALEKSIKDDIANYPAGANILQADFDTETDLRQEYGVTVQTTIIIFDEEGNPVKTLAAPSSAEVKQELAAVL